MKCTKMKFARAKRAKLLFFIIKYVKLWLSCHRRQRGCLSSLKPGFHIIVSVVSVVRKKFIGQMQIYGNLPYKCSIQKKRQTQLFVRDRMNSICPTYFFRTTDTTDTTIWKPGLMMTATATKTSRTCKFNDKKTKTSARPARAIFIST